MRVDGRRARSEISKPVLPCRRRAKGSPWGLSVGCMMTAAAPEEWDSRDRRSRNVIKTPVSYPLLSFSIYTKVDYHSLYPYQELEYCKR